MNDNKDSETTTDSEFSKKATAHIEPILKHLDTEDVAVEKDKIIELFVKLWEYEDGEKLDAATQRLTIIALFMYTAHNVLEDYNIRLDRARQYIIHALHEWVKPEIEKAMAKEKASPNPFKAFVDSNQNNFENIFSWEHFMPDIKKANETELNFKFKINVLSVKEIFYLKLNSQMINIIDINYKFNKCFDKISNKSNAYIEKSFDIALKLLRNNQCSGLINGPISKKHFLKGKSLGITEYLAKKTKKNTIWLESFIRSHSY